MEVVSFTNVFWFRRFISDCEYWWNGTGGELSSCVINTSIRSCIIIFGTLSEQIYQLTFYVFLLYVLVYMFMFPMYCDLHA